MLRRCEESETGEPAGQTLRDAVLASLALLTREERACLNRLAAFQWRWSVALARVIGCPSPHGSRLARRSARLGDWPADPTLYRCSRPVWFHLCRPS